MEIINQFNIPEPGDMPMACGTEALAPPHVWEGGGGNPPICLVLDIPKCGTVCQNVC